MAGGFVPRFLIEAGFLILLGVGAGYADLRRIVIVAVVAGGWLVVSLIELAVWRTQSQTVGPYIPQPVPIVPAAEVVETSPGEDTEPDDVAYPLRADAGAAPSEEVEAYTRVLGAERGEHDSRTPDERAE
jgi:hypothetical protein